jgi:hypothetical protein
MLPRNAPSPARAAVRREAFAVTSVAVLMAALAAGPAAQSARYDFFLGGAPAGQVTLTREADQFTWRSLHVFARRERIRTFTLRVDAQGRTAEGKVPEGLWLWARPARGCVSGVDEVTGRTGPLCAEPERDGAVRGNAFGAAFTARYDSAGRLKSLEMGASRFERSTGAAPQGEEPFAQGFPVEGSGPVVVVEPSSVAVRQLARLPLATGGSSAPEGDCLERSTAIVEASKGTKELVLGVVLQEGRAWPHAWVRDRKSLEAEDPSAVGPPAAGTAYLAFPSGHAGALYVELLQGSLQVVRRELRARGKSAPP